MVGFGGGREGGSRVRRGGGGTQRVSPRACEHLEVQLVHVARVSPPYRPSCTEGLVELPCITPPLRCQSHVATTMFSLDDGFLPLLGTECRSAPPDESGSQRVVSVTPRCPDASPELWHSYTKVSGPPGKLVAAVGQHDVLASLSSCRRSCFAQAEPPMCPR